MVGLIKLFKNSSNMKRIIAITGLLLMTLGIFSCHNAPWSFPNFNYTTTYFPNTYPIRTLVFGDYVYDNSGDKNLNFLISATMGGVYSNTKDINVTFAVDNTLCNNLYQSSNGAPIKALPTAWYTLTPATTITIPKGQFSGGTTVQLTADFTADTNSVNAYWAVPLRITAATGVDSILSGRTALTAPDPRVATNWAVVPMNFTIFAVKYVNEWAGKYLLRGTDVVTKVSDGSAIETINYHTQFLEGDAIVQLFTSRRNEVKYSNAVRLTAGSGNSYELKLDFNLTDWTQATLTGSTRFYPNTIVTTGSAKMVKAANSPESWGNLSRDVIYLDYSYTDIPTATGIYKGIPLSHHVKDTLVFRDKAVAYLAFSPSIH
jgi:hypothetical protein